MRKTSVRFLKCRVEIIETAIEKILEKLGRLPDDEYFKMILRLAGRKIHKGDGKIYFGKKDLARLPADFSAKLSAIATGSRRNC